MILKMRDSKFVQKKKRKFTLLVIVILSVGCAGLFLVGGFFYFQRLTDIANNQTTNNLQHAKQVYADMPIWHKKIQTEEDLKVGILTDTHVRASLSYKQLRPIRSFVADMQEFQPEFVINLGDVIDGSRETSAQGIYELKAVKKLLETTNVPVHWVIGNHDLRAVTKEQFKEALDLDSLDQSFDIGDYRFIILDANYLRDGTPRSPLIERRYIPGFLPDKTLDWLKNQLATDKRTFVFMHQGGFESKSVGDLDDDDDDDDYDDKNEIVEDRDWAKKTYKLKQSIKDVKKLRDIFKEYRVDGFFNGHMEARRFEKKDFTSYYSLTGTRKSKDFQQSYYELTITDGHPDVTMYYTPTGTTKKVVVDFEDKGNIVRERDTLVKDADGLEWNNGDKIVVGGERGIIFVNNVRRYIGEDEEEFEGIAMCHQKYYIGIEDKNELLILNNNFKKIGSVSLDSIDDKVEVEGIACAVNGLYVVTNDKVYNISVSGDLYDTIKIEDKNLSFADYYDGVLYILSKKDNSILEIKDKKIIDEIPIAHEKEVGGLKASPEVINIILRKK